MAEGFGSARTVAGVAIVAGVTSLARNQAPKSLVVEKPGQRCLEATAENKHSVQRGFLHFEWWPSRIILR